MADKVPCVKLNNGQSMPAFGYGTFNFMKEGEIRESTKLAIDVGFRHIDTALLYKTEGEIGDAIKEKIKNGDVKREDLFITTKLWNTDHLPDDVEKACRKSLQNLQLDYVDLYLVHWPLAVETEDTCRYDLFADKVTPANVTLMETWTAMEELVIKGLVKSIGISNFNVDQMKRIVTAENLRIKPVVNQVELHPYYTNDDVVDYCKSVGIVVTGYCPLARGEIMQTEPGKPVDILKNEVITKLAEKYKKTTAQIVLRWNIDAGVTTLSKSVTPARIKENFGIVDFSLNPEDVKTISALNVNYQTVRLIKFKDFPEYPFTWIK